MFAEFVKEEDIEEIVIGNVVILLLFHVDDVVLYEMHTNYEDIGRLLHAYKLSVNSSKQILCL